jgi:hypothetical protein
VSDAVGVAGDTGQPVKMADDTSKDSKTIVLFMVIFLSKNLLQNGLIYIDAGKNRKFHKFLQKSKYFIYFFVK